MAQAARRAGAPCRRRARGRRPPRPSGGRRPAAANSSATSAAPRPVAGATSVRERRFAGRKSTGGAPARLRLSVSGGRASRKIVPFARSASRWMRPPPCVARDVVDRRRRRGRLEQRPDRGQHGRLAARRLADERADRAGRELELARGAIPLDRDAPEQVAPPTASRCPERPEVDGRVAGLPAARGSAGAAGGARCRRARPDRRAGGRAPPRRSR